MQKPGPVRVPVDQPDHRDRDRAGKQEELSQLQVENADVEVARGEPECRHGRQVSVTEHDQRLQATVHCDGRRQAEHAYQEIHWKEKISVTI